MENIGALNSSVFGLHNQTTPQLMDKKLNTQTEDLQSPRQSLDINHNLTGHSHLKNLNVSE